MFSTIDLSTLDPRVSYCVLRDIQNRESIIASGRDIQRGWHANRDFQHFRTTEPWISQFEATYVRVARGADDHVLGLWRDPTRPELNADRCDAAPAELHTVRDDEPIEMNAATATQIAMVNPTRENVTAALVMLGARQVVSALFQHV